MLQGRLIGCAVVGLAALAACTGGSPIENEVVRPGVSAIEQASALSCLTDAETLRTAMDAYAAANGEQPVDETTLVAAGLLREPSSLWDIADGALRAQDPGCGPDAAGSTVPSSTPGSSVPDVDELTAELASKTPEEYLATVDQAEIDAVGGRDCALEVAEVVLADARWTLDRRREPTSLEELVDDGTLPELTRWKVRPTTLDPLPGSGCVGPVTLIERSAPVDDCRVAARTLEVAVEAYRAQFGLDAPPPTEQDLVDAGFLRAPDDLYDLVDGVPVPQAGGACPAAPVPPDTAGTPIPSTPVVVRTECEQDRAVLEAAIDEYTAQFGAPPTLESDLVEAGLIPNVRGWHEIAPSGDVVPTPSGGCD